MQMTSKESSHNNTVFEISKRSTGTLNNTKGGFDMPFRNGHLVNINEYILNEQLNPKENMVHIGMSHPTTQKTSKPASFMPSCVNSGVPSPKNNAKNSTIIKLHDAIQQEKDQLDGYPLNAKEQLSMSMLKDEQFTL